MFASLALLAYLAPRSESYLTDCLSVASGSVYYAHTGDSKLVKYSPGKSIVSLPFKLPQNANFVVVGSTQYVFGRRTSSMWVQSKGKWKMISLPGTIVACMPFGEKLYVHLWSPSKVKDSLLGSESTIAQVGGEKIEKKWTVFDANLVGARPFFVSNSHELITISQPGAWKTVCKLSTKDRPGRTLVQYVIAATTDGALVNDAGRIFWVTVSGQTPKFEIPDPSIQNTSGFGNALWSFGELKGKQYLFRFVNGRREMVEVNEPNGKNAMVAADAGGTALVFRPRGENSTAIYACLVRNGKLSLRLTNAEASIGNKSQIKILDKTLFVLDPQAGLKISTIPQ